MKLCPVGRLSIVQIQFVLMLRTTIACHVYHFNEKRGMVKNGHEFLWLKSSQAFVSPEMKKNQISIKNPKRELHFIGNSRCNVCIHKLLLYSSSFMLFNEETKELSRMILHWMRFFSYFIFSRSVLAYRLKW